MKCFMQWVQISFQKHVDNLRIIKITINKVYPYHYVCNAKGGQNNLLKKL